MAQILLITKETELAGVDEIGDLVGVYGDSHGFSEREKKAFQIVHVEGDRAEIEKKIQSLRPEISFVYKRKSDGKWTTDSPGKGDLGEQRQSWKNPADGKWYFLNKPAKHIANFKDLNASDFNSLENDDVGSMSKTAIDKMKKDPNRFTENQTEIPDIN